MSYITTYLKKHIDPTKASANDIDIVDIAHALSLLCRANGHFEHFYSVAQHSLNCANEAKLRGYSERVQLGCLLHDASEAYLSDVTRPIKSRLQKYLDIEEKLQNTIFDKWITPSLNKEELKQVFEIDDAVLYHEFLNLLDEKISDVEPQILSKLNYDFSNFSEVESKFIRRFKRLIGEKEDCFVGVDWIKGKWLAVELRNDIARYNAFDNIQDLCEKYENVDSILIDVPIGLPESAEQAEGRPDKLAKAYLKNKDRKSSIFPVPFRQMVYAKNKNEFWDTAKLLGAKPTPPTYGIIKCIRQVDDFLQKNPDWKNKLLESHPECAFQALNSNEGLVFPKSFKKGIDGIELRTRILSKYVDNIKALVDSASGKDKEDVLDACCLAVTAKLGFKSIPENPMLDSKGLKMQILVADI